MDRRRLLSLLSVFCLRWEQGTIGTSGKATLRPPKIDTDIYVTPTPMMRHFDKELQKLESEHGVGKVAAKVLKGNACS